jgi:hypothetical protein
MSSLYADVDGKNGAERDPDGDRRLRRQGAGKPIELSRPTTRTRPTSPLEGARVDRHAA